jgi:hypothetical protein
MSAAGLIRFRGAAVTFSKTTQAYDASAGTMTPSTATVAGYALQVSRGQRKNADGALIEGEEIELEFLPATAGQVPAIDSSVTFGGYSYNTVRVGPLTLNGTVSTTRVVVAR